LRRHLDLALLARQRGEALHAGKAQRCAMVLMIDAEEAARRRGGPARQRHVGDEVVVGPELPLLVRAGLLRGAVLRRATVDRVALPDQHLCVVPRREVVLVVRGPADLRKRERRGTVRACRRTGAHRRASEQTEGSASGDPLQHRAARQPRVDDLGDRGLG
jgi:hypothetical protein